METKHTPGPWEIEPSWSDRVGGDVSIVNREHSGDDWDVCTVHSTEANARLIAAAPELLAAMYSVEVLYAELGKALPGIVETSAYDKVQEAVKASRAAIARAVGNDG